MPDPDFLEVDVTIGPLALPGSLGVPGEARSVIVFAHGSGSGRNSPRNRFVAKVLQATGFGTLLMDLVTEEEEGQYGGAGFRLNIELLADRLITAAAWLSEYPATAGMKLGYFGASTGAGAAFAAASKKPGRVGAIVSRGGRPDLAGNGLRHLSMPVLLIVGSEDRPVISLNEQAFHVMTMAEKRIQIVPGAGHLFEEPGALEQVAHLAASWFRVYLPSAADGGSEAVA